MDRATCPHRLYRQGSSVRNHWRAGGRRGRRAGRSAERDDNAERATGAAFHLPGGLWIVYAAGLGIAGYGAYQVYRAVGAKLGRQLALDEMGDDSRRLVVAVSRIGIAARGLVMVAIGWLLFRAAAEHDAERAGGIGDALSSLARLGQWPYVSIGVGLIAYGVYELVNPRYRRIPSMSS